MDEDAVVLKIVDDEQEAEIVCGLLRSAGIECGYAKPAPSIRLSRTWRLSARARS